MRHNATWSSGVGPVLEVAMQDWQFPMDSPTKTTPGSSVVDCGRVAETAERRCDGPEEVAVAIRGAL